MEVQRILMFLTFKKEIKIVNIYRAKDFYDNSEKDTDFKMYKPLGDIIVPENNNYNKDLNDAIIQNIKKK